jgi:hypothetical protein
MSTTDRVTAELRVDGESRQVLIGGTEPQSENRARGEVPKDVIAKSESTNTAGVVKATILGDVSVGASAELRVQDETVHAGTVQKSEPGTGDRQRVTSFDVSHQLKQTILSINFDTISADIAFQRVADAVDVDLDIRFLVTPFESITTTFKEKQADQIIAKLTKLTDTISFVNSENELVIADPENAGAGFELTQVIDVSAGVRRPQYQSVQVIGNTATAERGLDARHLISSQPILAEAGEGQPSFIFEDDSIASQQQAVNVAESLLRKLKKQQRGGFVSVVGRPEIRPFDSVTLPPAQGGQTFLVARVEHTISDTDGFRTRLSLGGSIR